MFLLFTAAKISL